MPMGCPYVTWMDNAMHEIKGSRSLGHTMQVDHKTGRTLLQTGTCGAWWSAGAEVLVVCLVILVVWFQVFAFPSRVRCWGPRLCVLHVRRWSEAVALRSEWPFIVVN